MKKIAPLIILIFIITIRVNAQSCLPEGIIFDSQELIDNFPTNYPYCTEIEGNVWITNESITNLDGLSAITSIGGYLEFDNSDSSLNLSGLINLTSIGTDLNFYSADIFSLSGLDNLISIGRDLNIYECYNLTSLSGLQSLTSIGRDATIKRSHLTNLSGLEELYFMGRDFYIIRTSLNNLIGLDKLQSIGRDFHIKGNADLVNMEGMSSLNTIEGDLIFGSYSNYRGNSSLINLMGLESLSSIGGSLRMKENDALVDLTGLESLHIIGINLWLEDNYSLSSLTGLNNLDTLAYGIYLIDNPTICSLSKLQNLNALGGNVWIQNANCLSTLSGLENINPEYIAMIILIDNDSLKICEVNSICTYLALPNAESLIMNNALGCNNLEEIEQACNAADIDDFVPVSFFTISPNPADSYINISNEYGEIIYGIKVYNSYGQQILHNTFQSDKIDISMLSNGLYIFELITNDMKYRQKIMIN